MNGGGYKKTPIGGDANRFNTMDFEGRISAVYEGFNLAVGGYTGKLGTASGTPTVKTANASTCWAPMSPTALRVGVEYFTANNYQQRRLWSTPHWARAPTACPALRPISFLPRMGRVRPI